MSMVERLDEQQIERARECFNLHAPQGNLPRDRLALLLRSLNVTPTIGEIEVMAGETQTFDFPSFLEILAKSPQPADAKADVLAAFKAYDQAGTGTISKADLSFLLKSIGEGLSDAEIAETLAGQPDPVDYNAFVQQL
ncbi:uncharacterized protein MONBRDRAFT_34524 [Monosiga brevicollis MX1]|uniref:EF-hand domain-containing protein n=1 Tax=Monosiga brevicollis TaxID=81824 RepID=A9VCA0_MONBE|nr:uncharacterized protein MONBRDRAFT_34524 [Monosiga brevicollis MX1]EDQ84863.1 predicted protein [Monosiga brevicollis MX1]|eukprot:XP_001750364.1 hypothetical protein [Monosiga brevicollis MX1]